MKNKVEEQYTNWVYPAPIEDLMSAIKTGKYYEIGDPLMYWPLMWPHKRGVGKLDILSAGCGTNQAAYYAFRNPEWNVVGIDLSDSSIAHQQFLKEKHNLTNLTLKKFDLIKVKSLGLDFDFITCTGVLHHLPNPDEGLAALKSVLRPEGVMNLMVYGTSLRLGVYMLQEVFRILGFDQAQSDVDIVKETIASLNHNHVLRRYADTSEDLRYDSGIVDTFLHTQDRSYSIRELFKFTQNAGLDFINWCDSIEYSLEHAVPKSHSLWRKINNQQLSTEDRYQICDLLVQNQGTHRWICAHPTYVKKIKISFEDDSFYNCTLMLHRNAKLIAPSDLNKKTTSQFERESFKFYISPNLTLILEGCRTKKSINEVLNSLKIEEASKNQILTLLKAEIKSLYERGHIYVLLPEEK